jgi:hypothetical protein
MRGLLALPFLLELGPLARVQLILFLAEQMRRHLLALPLTPPA